MIWKNVCWAAAAVAACSFGLAAQTSVKRFVADTVAENQSNLELRVTETPMRLDLQGGSANAVGMIWIGLNAPHPFQFNGSTMWLLLPPVVQVAVALDASGSYQSAPLKVSGWPVGMSLYLQALAVAASCGDIACIEVSNVEMLTRMQ